MIAVYIDVQNLHKTTHRLGRIIDRQKLYIYISNKYKADKIYYVVGHIQSKQWLYDKLSDIGYVLLFKETIFLHDGEIKGNVDIDIGIKASFDICRNGLIKAYLITNDGDYNTLIQTFIDENVYGGLIVPDRYTASQLLKKFNKTILDIQDIKPIIQKIPE